MSIQRSYASQRGLLGLLASSTLVFARSSSGEAPYHWVTAAFMTDTSILATYKGNCSYRESVCSILEGAVF